MDGFVFVIVMLGVVGVGIVFGRRHAKRLAAQFGTLATRLGLEHLPPGPGWKAMLWTPEANGILRGKKVRLYNYTTGSGKSRTTWSAVSAEPRLGGALEFSLEPQGFGSAVMAFFGYKEITVGDPAFDARWFIRTNKPDYLGAALLPELRVKLDQLHSARARGTFKLERGTVVYSERGTFGNPALCERFVLATEIVCDLADVAEVFEEHR